MPVYKNPEDAPSDLQRLLLVACPENTHGNKSILYLSQLLKISRWSIQKWINNDKIPPGRAMEVVDLSEGRVSLADFSRYIYKL